ncbi:MAG TPA: succinate dehydrogenase, cytochrome b556 subunit, partial [Alphaproteobacteria bacterium]|nr:succinate dehydrogenase, cytochrome b556 subunit [Alphaproteobacteria bacterium]
ALCFHFCAGIRHLFWDSGKGYDIKTVYKSGYAVLFFSTALTIAAWATVIIYGHN